MEFRTSVYSAVEIELRTSGRYGTPNLECEVFADFVAPSGATRRVYGFHDGGDLWRIRFAPDEPGRWTFVTGSLPPDDGLAGRRGSLEATEAASPGFLRAAAHEPWHFRFDDGSVPLILGDTMYNLFAASHSGLNVEAALRRRKDQGFNHVRVRVTPSPFHPHTPFSNWMTANCFLWGGSLQCPEYDRFNLEYLASVERTMSLLQSLDMGVELILEAWLFEAPFNDRSRFLPEHEELFLQHIIARLGAYRSLWMWCVANEYNLYAKSPHEPINDRYAIRLARLVRRFDAHRHPVAVHVTAAERMEKTFGQRFAHVDDVDVLLMQYWGDNSTPEKCALAVTIEQEMQRSLGQCGKSVVFSEYGYERSPLPPGAKEQTFSGMGPDHTRRGALRALFMGYPVDAGFQTTWGPAFTLENEPLGAEQFRWVRKLLSELADLRCLRPMPELIRQQQTPADCQALCLSDGARRLVYLPAGGSVWLNGGAAAKGTWFDPATGEQRDARSDADGRFTAPSGNDGVGNARDWALVV